MEFETPAIIPPDQSDRVRQHTAPEVQQRIDRRIETNIRLYSNQPIELLDQRLAELDEEVDVERVLQTNASSLALTGVVMGVAVDRKWLLLSAGVLGFLFMHAVKGWCPPLPALRRLGLRTRQEIDREKYALKAIRGDLDMLRPAQPGLPVRGLEGPAIRDQ